MKLQRTQSKQPTGLKIVFALCLLHLSAQTLGQTFLNGDIAPPGDGDGKVDQDDFIRMDGLAKGFQSPTYIDMKVGDLNQDGLIDMTDSGLLKSIMHGQTVVDTAAPNSVNAISTSIDFDGSTASIIGAPGAAEPGSTVTAYNTRSGGSQSQTASDDGSFSVTLSAQELDQISVTASDSQGNVSSATLFKLNSDPVRGGSYGAGWIDIDEPEGLAAPQNPGDWEPRLLWARMMYPTDNPSGGELQEVSDAGPFPLVVFVHLKSSACDADGSESGLNVLHASSPDCDATDRVPLHEGYTYLMEKLASYGIASISISRFELFKHSKEPGSLESALLVLKTIDRLVSWNNSGGGLVGDLIRGKLDLQTMGFVGHSSGAEIVANAFSRISDNAPYSVVAYSMIAPSYSPPSGHSILSLPYFGIRGTRDGDGAATIQHAFSYHDLAIMDDAGVPSTVALVYGANHKYFNTVTTDTAALGEENPWAGSKDDGADNLNGVPVFQPKLSAEQQRNITLRTMVPFFRWQLQNQVVYKNVMTGKYRYSGSPYHLLSMSHHDGGYRVVVDNYSSADGIEYPQSNSLQGEVEYHGFTRAISYNDLKAAYPFQQNVALTGGSYAALELPAPCGGEVNHEVGGVTLSWDGPSEYITHLPASNRNVTPFRYLKLRVAYLHRTYPFLPFTMNKTVLRVNVSDAAGRSGVRSAPSDRFSVIPTPQVADQVSGRGGVPTCVIYSGRGNTIALSTLYFPLSEFKDNDSGIDYSNLEKISIKFEGEGSLILSGIEFTH